MCLYPENLIHLSMSSLTGMCGTTTLCQSNSIEELQLSVLRWRTRGWQEDQESGLDTLSLRFIKHSNGKVEQEVGCRVMWSRREVHFLCLFSTPPGAFLTSNFVDFIKK